MIVSLDEPNTLKVEVRTSDYDIAERVGECELLSEVWMLWDFLGLGWFACCGVSWGLLLLRGKSPCWSSSVKVSTDECST